MTPPRVLVVRSGPRSFAEACRDRALEIVERATHSVEPVSFAKSAIAGPVDLVLFTSQIAVERILGDRESAALLREAVSRGEFAAVGPATAAALARRGALVTHVASGSASSLLALLPENLRGKRVLHPVGEGASEELRRGLEARGASFERVIVYRKVPAPFDGALGHEILDHPFAAFCATSPLSARWLLDGLPEQAGSVLRRTVAVALGASTRHFLTTRGVGRVLVPERATFAEAARLLESLAVRGRGA